MYHSYKTVWSTYSLFIFYFFILGWCTMQLGVLVYHNRTHEKSLKNPWLKFDRKWAIWVGSGHFGAVPKLVIWWTHMREYAEMCVNHKWIHYTCHWHDRVDFVYFLFLFLKPSLVSFSFWNLHLWDGISWIFVTSPIIIWGTFTSNSSNMIVTKIIHRWIYY